MIMGKTKAKVTRGSEVSDVPDLRTQIMQVPKERRVVVEVEKTCCSLRPAPSVSVNDATGNAAENNDNADVFGIVENIKMEADETIIDVAISQGSSDLPKLEMVENKVEVATTSANKSQSRQSSQLAPEVPKKDEDFWSKPLKRRQILSKVTDAWGKTIPSKFNYFQRTVPSHCLKVFKKFRMEFAERWRQANRLPKRFANRNKNWLEETVWIPPKILGLEEAVNLLIQADFSEDTYKYVSKLPFCYLPPFKEVTKALEDAYPSDIQVDGRSVNVCLKSLLEHTARRILMSLDSLPEEENLQLIVRWLSSRSSIHDENNLFWAPLFGMPDLEDICISSLTPIEISAVKGLVWKNPRPWSRRYCRPIRIRCVTDEPDFMEKEINYIDSNSASIEVFDVVVQGKTYKFTLVMLHTAQYDNTFYSGLWPTSTPPTLNYVPSGNAIKFHLNRQISPSFFDVSTMTSRLPTLNCKVRSVDEENFKRLLLISDPYFTHHSKNQKRDSYDLDDPNDEDDSDDWSEDDTSDDDSDSFAQSLFNPFSSCIQQ